MAKFFEIILEGKSNLINYSNIAKVTQISPYAIEIHLLTKNDGEQISYEIPVNYGEFKYYCTDESDSSPVQSYVVVT